MKMMKEEEAMKKVKDEQGPLLYPPAEWTEAQPPCLYFLPVSHIMTKIVYAAIDLVRMS
jgi:hypothetical protein